MKASGKQTITLRQARLNNHLSLEYVAGHVGLSVEQIEAYEEDSGPTEIHHAVMLCKLYKLSMNHIYFGKTPKGRVEDMGSVKLDFLDFAYKRIEESEVVSFNHPLYIEHTKKISTLMRDLMVQNPSDGFRSMLFELEEAFNFTSACEHEGAYRQGFKDAINLFA